MRVVKVRVVMVTVELGLRRWPPRGLMSRGCERRLGGSCFGAAKRPRCCLRDRPPGMSATLPPPGFEDSLAVSAAAAGVTPKRLHSRVERANLGPFSAQRHTCISSEQTVIASYHLCEATLRKTARGNQKISEQRL